jgi:hypothetical protein
MVNSNITIGSLPTLQISLVIVTLFEKIYNGEPIFTLLLYDVKSVSQPDTMPILGYYYCLQIIETGFAEKF